MKLKDLVKFYGEKRRVCLTSDNGVTRLVMGESLLLNFEPSLDERGFFLYASLGDVPQDEEKEIFEQALHGNLFGSQTGRANIGFVPQNHLLVLFEYFDEATTELALFEQEVDLFYRYLLFWLEKLKKIHSEIKEPPPLQNYLRGLQETGKMKIFFA